jgi:hypothetical protein
MLKLNISAIMVKLTNVTYIFGNMEADNVEHLCNHSSAHKKNVTYYFGHIETDKSL